MLQAGSGCIRRKDKACPISGKMVSGACTTRLYNVCEFGGTREFSAELLWGGLLKRRTLGKGKGCDIGYALAISSCEGANSVEACTVTALDAITAFAVPNPNCPSQSRRFFQVWLLSGSPRRADHSAYFGLAKYYLANPFSHRRVQP